MQTNEIRQIIQNYIKDQLPMPPVLSKVIKLYETSGKATFNSCIYSADVQVIILDNEGNFKDSDLIIPDVPILSIGIGNNQGIYFLPAIGSIVKISFLYGSLAYPVIDGVLPYFSQIPQHNEKDLNIYVANNKNENIKNLWNGNYNKVQLKADAGFTLTGNFTLNGNLQVNGNITATQQIADLSGKKGTLSQLRDVFNTHTHKHGKETTTPPTQTI